MPNMIADFFFLDKKDLYSKNYFMQSMIVVFPTYVGENYINNEGSSNFIFLSLQTLSSNKLRCNLCQIKNVLSGQNEHITSASAKLTPQATKKKRIDPISSSRDCQRIQEIQKYQRSTSTFKKFKSIMMNILKDPLKSK